MKMKSTAVFIGTTLMISGLLDLLDSQAADSTETSDQKINVKKVGMIKAGIGALAFAAIRTESEAQIYNRSVSSGFVGMSVMGYLPKADHSFKLMPIFAKQVAESVQAAIR